MPEPPPASFTSVKYVAPSVAKDGLAAYVVEVEKALVEEAEKHVKYKAKAKRHKRKNIKYSDKYSACEKNLMETQAELAFTEDLLEGLTAANVHLYDKLGCANRYIYFCSPTLKNRFKQWWTGIYHIDKLREKL